MKIDGDSMELTLIQKRHYFFINQPSAAKRPAIKGEEIAEVIQRNPGTIRNQMQLLKAWGL